MGTGGPDPPPPLKNHKNIGFLSNTDLNPLENQKASIQCRAIIGPPGKRHLNDEIADPRPHMNIKVTAFTAFKWRFAVGLMMTSL